MLILKHAFVCIIYNMLYKINFVFLIIFTLWINVLFFVILDALNLTVFVRYYCIQKSKLKLEMGFAMFHNDYWYRTVAHYSRDIWKASDFHKKGTIIFILFWFLFVFTSELSLRFTFVPALSFISSKLEPPFIIDNR